AQAGAELHELLDRDLVGGGGGIPSKMPANRVIERQLAGGHQLGDGNLREDFVDRAEVELRVDTVRTRVRGVGEAVGAPKHRLAIFCQHDHAGELPLRRSAVGDALQRQSKREKDMDHLDSSAAECSEEL